MIASRKDYEWARFKCDEYHLTDRVGDVLFSPVHGALEPRELAEWILADRLHVFRQGKLVASHDYRTASHEDVLTEAIGV